MTYYNNQFKYKNEWDARGYLNSKYCDPVQFNMEFQYTIDFVSSYRENSLSILEYSGGPSILKLINLVPTASEIVFSDFLEPNRLEVKKWLDDDPSAFDWKPAIKHCLKLEGSCGDAEDIYKRESMLRDKIKAVVHCDLTSHNIVEEGYEGPYDLVNCDGVLDDICTSKEQFAEGVKKLSSLVKKGGYLMITTDDTDSYSFSGIEFINVLDLSKEDIQDAFLATGLVNVSCKCYMSYDDTFLTIGQKA